MIGEHQALPAKRSEMRARLAAAKRPTVVMALPAPTAPAGCGHSSEALTRGPQIERSWRDVNMELEAEAAGETAESGQRWFVVASLEPCDGWLVHVEQTS